MTEELKPRPCLSCKSNKILVGDDRNAINELYGYVLCVDCGLRMEAFKGNWEDARGSAIAKWNRRASPWVSNHDNFPRRGKRYFVCGIDHGILSVADYIGFCFHEVDSYGENTGTTWTINTITHWMPIPPLPEQE